MRPTDTDWLLARDPCLWWQWARWEDETDG